MVELVELVMLVVDVVTLVVELVTVVVGPVTVVVEVGVEVLVRDEVVVDVVEWVELVCELFEFRVSAYAIPPAISSATTMATATQTPV